MSATRVILGRTFEFAATFFDQHDAAITPDTVKLFLRQGKQAVDTADLVPDVDGVWIYEVDTGLYDRGLLSWTVEATLASVKIVEDGLFNLVAGAANLN